MRNRKAIHMATATLFVFVLCSGFVCTGSQMHQATVAEHDFKIAVQGFQNAEASEFQAGAIPAPLNQQMQGWILTVAEGGKGVATAIQSNDKAGAIAALSSLDATLQTMNTDGVLHISDPDKKNILALSLQAVQAVVTNIQTVLAQ